jgi:hypothetical protein
MPPEEYSAADHTIPNKHLRRQKESPPKLLIGKEDGNDGRNECPRICLLLS